MVRFQGYCAKQIEGQIMSKRSSAKYKLDRRMGENIWGRPKSPVNKREYGPGQHGQRRKSKISDYGIQLKAKQKLKGYYRSEEHTSELQSLMRISYAVFCLKKKKKKHKKRDKNQNAINTSKRKQAATITINFKQNKHNYPQTKSNTVC